MGLEAACAVAACVVLFLMAVRVAGGTVRTVSGMFRAPDLGWPSGVQEDDDLHWTWSATSPDTGDTARQQAYEPDLMELEPSSLGLALQPLQHGVRR